MSFEGGVYGHEMAFSVNTPVTALTYQPSLSHRPPERRNTTE